MSDNPCSHLAKILFQCQIELDKAKNANIQSLTLTMHDVVYSNPRPKEVIEFNERIKKAQDNLDKALIDYKDCRDKLDQNSD